MILLISAMFIFCAYYGEVTLSIKKSISLCVEILIPSLLPCLVLSNIIIESNLIYLFPKRTRIYFLFLLSSISGYPVGANLLNECVLNGQISKLDAKKILPSFINAGPGFVISFIGCEILENKAIGIILYFSQIFASCLLFLIGSGIKVNFKGNYITSTFSNIVFSSINKAFNSLKNICLFVLLFFSSSEIVYQLFGSKTALYFSFFGEVTSAVINQKNVYIVSFLLSWCGLCIYFQVFSITKYKISVLKVILFRVLHACISIITTKILLNVFKINSSVFSNTKSEVSITLPTNFTYFIAITFSLICLLFSISRKSSGKLSNDLI